MRWKEIGKWSKMKDGMVDKKKSKKSNRINPKIDLTFEHFVNTIRH